MIPLIQSAIEQQIARDAMGDIFYMIGGIIVLVALAMAGGAGVMWLHIIEKYHLIPRDNPTKNDQVIPGSKVYRQHIRGQL